MFIYHWHIFVLLIIHQNNPVSKSVRCIIPGFLRNRSYRRRAPSYRRHPVKLPSSVIWDKFAYRRLAANLSGTIVQKREQIRVCRFGARCIMPPCFSVENLREIGGRKEARAGKNFSKLAAASGAILTTVASCGCPQCYGIRSGPVLDPEGRRTTREGIDTTRICKNPARASYVAVRGPYGPRTGCSRAVYDL